MLPEKFDLDVYKQILLRRKWLIAATSLIIMLAGFAFAAFAPKEYEASTLILVQRQKVPENYIKATVADTLSDRISTIREQVTSRTNLEGLIKKFNLYEGKSDLIMQDKVELMRKNIDIRVSKGAAFSIAFRDSYPRKTMQVADALARNFADENTRVREDLSIGTTDFLENELARIEQQLHDKEAVLTAYKQQHLGALPDQLETNLRLLGQLRQKIESLDRSIAETGYQRITLQGQVSDLKQMKSSSSDQLGIVDSDAGSGGSPELSELKAQLEKLRLRYTDSHPDIVKLKKTIAKLEEDQAKAASGGSNVSPEGGQVPAAGGMFEAQVDSLRTQLASLDQAIKDLRGQRAKLEAESAKLASVVGETPKRQMELMALERDYDVIKRQYDSLLAKKLDSQVASNLERKQKGEQFLIIDPAKLPERPVSPNIPAVVVGSIIAGLAAGFGLALGLEYLDQSFRDHAELERFMQIPVLAVIPRLETGEKVSRATRLKRLLHLG